MKLTWFHGEDYELQARKQGFTLGRMDVIFRDRYRAIFKEYMTGYMTYTKYIRELKKLEKDLNRYAETCVSVKARSVLSESCFLEQGITQGVV